MQGESASMGRLRGGRWGGGGLGVKNNKNNHMMGVGLEYKPTMGNPACVSKITI